MRPIRRKCFVQAWAFVCLSNLVFLASSMGAQKLDTSASEVERRANIAERLAKSIPVTTNEGGSSPKFLLDPAWPKPLPHHWLMGDVGGIAVDRHDHIWVYHRPRSLDSNDSGMQGAVGENAKGVPISPLGFPRPFGPNNNCCTPAPSVLEFDKAGNLIQAWGGPADPGFLESKCRQDQGCFWPAREHGIYVDNNDFVYLSGNGQALNLHGQFPWAPNFGNDSQILKFKADGTFVYQIGTAGAKEPNSNDINGGANGTPEPFWAADMVVDPKTNLLYVADGYGNRRVLIVDAASGKYVGHFGAYGQNPVVGENNLDSSKAGKDVGSWAKDYRAGNMKPMFFRKPVHCVTLTNDGLLYVCDRGNNRIQIFEASAVGKPCSNPHGDAGKCGFVGEFHVAPQTVGGTAGTVNFSKDKDQSCIFITDLNNDVEYVVNRANLSELSRFGGGGRQAGEFHWPHVASVDSEGNIYIGEVDGAARVQKFLRYGPVGCSGTGKSQIGAYTQ